MYKIELEYNETSLIIIANTSCESLGRFPTDSSLCQVFMRRNQHLVFSALHTNVNKSLKAHNYSSF